MPLTALTGSRLRERRRSLGRRQADVAAAAGISASYLNLIEHNRRRVAGDVLIRLAAALDMDVGVLEAGAAAGLADGLRSAAAETGGDRGATVAAELDRLEDFIGRFPGWAGVTAGLQARVGQLEQAVAALNDRIAHDPHLGLALHDMLSAVSSVRSTAAILAETDDLEPEWRLRFHGNLQADSERLALGAEALVAYLEGTEAEATSGVVSPQDELDGWLDRRGWHLAELEADPDADLTGEIAGLATAAGRDLARDWVAQARVDRLALPLVRLEAALESFGPDPARIAAQAGADVLAVMRRIATRPGATEGLVICDAAGALIFRKPTEGFRPPRFGAACALWPLFGALARPGLPVEARLRFAGRGGRPFLARAWGQQSHPGGFAGVEVRQAGMLLLPLPGPARAEDLRAVGATCRICPETGCPARREASILSESIR